MGNIIKIKYEYILNDFNLLRAAKNTMRNGVRFKMKVHNGKLNKKSILTN